MGEHISYIDKMLLQHQRLNIVLKFVVVQKQIYFFKNKIKSKIIKIKSKE